MNVIKNDIETGEYKRVYLLYGEERFLVNSFKKQLREKICGDDTMNLSVFDSKEMTQQDIIDSADTMPFFADRRLVIVDDSGYFKKESAALADYISRIPETTVLVFVENQVDKRNRLFKKVDEIGHAALFSRKTEQELEKWILLYLNKDGYRITGNAIRLLMDMVGDDMENVANELEKLMSYVGERKEIYPNDVDEICTKQVVGRIFVMIDAVSSGKQAEALNLYYDLLVNKEPPLKILKLITTQFNHLLKITDLKAKGAGKGEIAKAIGKAPFVTGKLIDQAARFGAAKIRKNIELCAWADEAIKTGNMTDNMAVEMLIVESTQRK